MPEQPPISKIVAPGQRLGRPILTTWEAIAQSLAIGPIFSTAFVAVFVVAAAGAATPLSILLAAVGMLCVGWIIALYARRYAGAGAIYDYLRRVSPLWVCLLPVFILWVFWSWVAWVAIRRLACLLLLSFRI